MHRSLDRAHYRRGVLLLPLVAVAIGLVLGWARRGTLRTIAGTSLRRPGLLVGGVVVQTLATLVELPAGVVFVMAAHTALVAFCLANWRLTGLTVVAIGLSANLVCIGLNGGMPVRPDALVRSGLATSEDIDAGVALRGERHVETDSDRLVFLGDIVPLRPTRQVLSFGDLIVLVGLADVAMNLMLRRRDDTRPSIGDVMRLDPFARTAPARSPAPATGNGARVTTGPAAPIRPGIAAASTERPPADADAADDDHADDGHSGDGTQRSNGASNGATRGNGAVDVRRGGTAHGIRGVDLSDVPDVSGVDDAAAVSDVDDESLAGPAARPTTVGPERSRGDRAPGRPPASLSRTSDEPSGGERPPKRSWIPRLLGRGHPLGDDDAFWRNVRDDDADRAFWDADDPDEAERDPRDQTGTVHAARERSSATSGSTTRR